MAPGMSSLTFSNTTDARTPAILGGKPVITADWPKWPMWDPETDEKSVLDVIRSGVWSRNNVVDEFEKKWAEKIETKRCLMVVNGTNALIVSLLQFDVGAGDEVIVPAYTFIASIAAVLATGAMPVFVDTDPETFQIDTRKIESKINSRTRAIMPVHMAGMPADMIRIMEIAKKHNLLIIEDACQAHLAEVNNQKVGTLGHAGCFSFQNTKNLTIGEGGAIVSNDDAFMDRCYSYHNFGLQYGSAIGSVNSGAVIKGNKLRLTEYQAAIGLAQLNRLEAQTTTRTENADYLKSHLQNIPGILTYKLYESVTRAAYHLFLFRYKKEEFQDLSRSGFMNALQAEGVPCFGGYGTLTDKSFLENAFNSKNYKKTYSAKALDIKKYRELNKCPETDRICNEEAVWFGQNLLLAGKSEMDGIVSAINKIQKNAGNIKKTINK